MKKIRLLVCKFWYKIIFGVIIFLFAYSHLTSYKISQEMNNFLDQHWFIQLSEEEYFDYFEENNFQYGIIEDDLTKIDFYAHIGSGRVEIQENRENEYKIITFENTPDTITPLFKEMEWQDSLNVVKAKLQINPLNTRFNSWRKLNTLINYNENMIVISKGNQSDYQMMLLFDENRALYRISVICWK